MAVAVVSSTSTNTGVNTATTITIPVAGGGSDGDLLLAAIASAGGTADITTPPAWTEGQKSRSGAPVPGGGRGLGWRPAPGGHRVGWCDGRHHDARGLDRGPEDRLGRR